MRPVDHTKTSCQEGLPVYIEQLLYWLYKATSTRFPSSSGTKSRSWIYVNTLTKKPLIEKVLRKDLRVIRMKYLMLNVPFCVGT